MMFPLRRHRSVTDSEADRLGLVRFVNANAGLRGVFASSRWSAAFSITIHTILLIVMPAWRFGVGFDPVLEPEIPGAGGIIYVMPVLPDDVQEVEMGGELMSADPLGDLEGTASVAGTMAGATQGAVVTDAEYGSLLDRLGNPGCAADGPSSPRWRYRRPWRTSQRIRVQGRSRNPPSRSRWTSRPSTPT
jgi:hypothetical protein